MTARRPFELLIFDWDGTLMDSIATIVACTREAFAAAGLAPPDEAVVREIEKLEGFSLPFSGPFFDEFVVRAPTPASPMLDQLAKEKGIDGGIALSRFEASRQNDFLVCVTEMNTREEIDALIAGLRSLSQ